MVLQWLVHTTHGSTDGTNHATIGKMDGKTNNMPQRVVRHIAPRKGRIFPEVEDSVKHLKTPFVHPSQELHKIVIEIVNRYSVVRFIRVKGHKRNVCFLRK